MLLSYIPKSDFSAVHHTESFAQAVVSKIAYKTTNEIIFLSRLSGQGLDRKYLSALMWTSVGSPSLRLSDRGGYLSIRMRIYPLQPSTRFASTWSTLWRAAHPF